MEVAEDKEDKPKDRKSGKDAALERPAANLPDVLRFSVQGLNAVTKALERDQLCLALVTRNVQPPLLIQHLPHLAHVHRTVLCAIPELSTLLAPLLHVKTMLAIGFRRELLTALAPEHPLRALVAFVTLHAPKLEIPWLRPLDELRTEEASEEGLAAPDVGYLGVNIKRLVGTPKLKSAEQAKGKKPQEANGKDSKGKANCEGKKAEKKPGEDSKGKGAAKKPSHKGQGGSVKPETQKQVQGQRQGGGKSKASGEADREPVMKRAKKDGK
jgi:ribosomal protein L7Ae-like RNA K-turn-binding protein